MDKINQQATNEVRELLGELVVSPVSSDVNATITKLEETLTNLGIENEEKIKNFHNSISVDIIKLSNKLESEWQLNELNNNIQGCESTCKTIKQKVVSLNENILSIKENCQRNVEDINKTLQCVKKSENDLPDKIGQCIKETIRTVSDKTDSLSSDMEKLKTDISNISTKINEIRDIVHPYPEQLSNSENKFLEQIQHLSHDNDERYSEVKDNINDLRTLLKDIQHDNKTNIQLMNKSYKLSFFTLLILIINSFGIIGLFLIYFLK